MKKNLNCIHAVASLATEADGSTKICCLSLHRFSDRGRVLNLSQDSIEKSWNNPLRSEITEALEKGEEHPNCELCWSEEKAGRGSKRTRDNNLYAGIEIRNDQPVILDLKLGHLCNLKCRTCGTHSSSKWIEEEFATSGQSESDLPYFKQKFESYQTSFSQDNPMWGVLNGWSKNVSHFDFFGGEPMLIARHWDVLKKCVESGSSASQTIHYNTNGTIFPEKHSDLYRHFKGLNVSISLDGIGKRFEYMRHPAKWDLILRNLEKWRELMEGLEIPETDLHVCLTVSLLNLYYLDESIEEFSKMGLGLYLNLVHWPDYLSIQNLPDPLKQRMFEKLDRCLLGSPKQPDIRGLANFMQQKESNPTLWREFLTKTRVHDDYRKESFRDVFSEYVEFLGPHFENY